VTFISGIRTLDFKDTDQDPDPAPLVSGFQDANKNKFFSQDFLLLTYCMAKVHLHQSSKKTSHYPPGTKEVTKLFKTSNQAFYKLFAC
jgi:hypothetical protein